MQETEESEEKDYPIVRRVSVAIYHVIAIEDLRGFKTFCDQNDLDVRNLKRLMHNPHRQMNLELLTLLVEKYAFSAHWLLTGEGSMQERKLKRVVKKENA